MQDALGAFLCGKWNIHIRKASSDQPARDWWWFFAALTAPSKAFSITSVQLSSSSIQNLWEGAQGGYGFAFLGHRVGSAVGILCWALVRMCQCQPALLFSGREGLSSFML